MPISPKDAEALAYYRSADGIGLLAPRGWYCAGASGSSGYTLFLSPKPIHHDPFSGYEGLEGPAIEISHITSENGSGRFEIAETITRVFPEHKAIATRIWSGMDVPLPSGPYPRDTVKHIGKTVVEYKTPAHAEGLGNFNSWLKKSDLPILGAVILMIDPPNLTGNSPNLVRLSVRLPPNLAPLTKAIIRYVEGDVVGVARR